MKWLKVIIMIIAAAVIENNISSLPDEKHVLYLQNLFFFSFSQIYLIKETQNCLNRYIWDPN